MTSEKIVDNLWSLANGITSFAVLQALAFLYALGNPNFASVINNPYAQVMVMVATLIFYNSLFRRSQEVLDSSVRNLLGAPEDMENGDSWTNSLHRCF